MIELAQTIVRLHDAGIDEMGRVFLALGHPVPPEVSCLHYSYDVDKIIAKWLEDLGILRSLDRFHVPVPRLTEFKELEPALRRIAEEYTRLIRRTMFDYLTHRPRRTDERATSD